MIVVIDINSNVMTYAAKKTCINCSKTSDEPDDLLQGKGWIRRWSYGPEKFEWLCSNCSSSIYVPQIRERVAVVP